MDPELRGTLQQEMDMIGPHLHAQLSCLMLLTRLLNDGRQALRYPLKEYLASILGAADDVRLARGRDGPIGCVP